MRIALICAAATLATSSFVFAAEPASTAPAAEVAKDTKAPKTRKVCRREQPTGSTIPKRVCRTVPVAPAGAEAARDSHAGHASAQNAAASR